VTIPSLRVRAGDVVALAAASPVRPVAADATELMAHVSPWLLSDPGALVGRVVRAPVREEIRVPADEQLVVEHYARR
jgi:small subunit ribosomal protein S4